MLLELVLFFTLAAAITTAAVMVPGLIQARAWAGIPLALAILIGAGWLTGLIVDVFSRRSRIAHRAESTYQPPVAIQVPCYNEPIEVVRETLTALSHLDYPNVVVQVVDNNTKDPQVWRPLEALCAELGSRFQFIHLDPWPGYKAGALNEATRRLPADVTILAIVDADYIVRPGFLK